MSNTTHFLVPWFEPAKPWSNVADYRYCADGMCATCPYEYSFYGAEHVLVMKVIFYAAMVAALANAFVLMVYAILPRKKTNCNIYTSGIAAANICFAAGFLFARTHEDQVKTLCYDAITRATGLRVSRCALSGLLLVYGYLSTRFWSLLWVMDMHFSIVHNQRFTGLKRNWSVAVVVVIPVALALASLPFLSYILGPFCLPSPGYPLYVIMEAPVAFIDGATIILQVCTLVCVIRALLQSRMVGGSVPVSTRSSLSTISQIKNIPLVKACILLARPILYTQLIHVSNILLGVSFVYNWSPINSHGKISERWQHHLAVWLTCLGAGQGEECIITDALALGRLRSAGLLVTLLVEIMFVVLSIRLDNLQALGVLLRDSCRAPRTILQRDRHPSDLFEAKASFFSMPVALAGQKSVDPGSKSAAEVQVTQTYLTTTLTPDTNMLKGQDSTSKTIDEKKICSATHQEQFKHSDLNKQSSDNSRVSSACNLIAPDVKQQEEVVERCLTDGADRATTVAVLPWSRHSNITGRGSFDSDVRPFDDLTPTIEIKEQKDYVD